jgi:hypothetical protein
VLIEGTAIDALSYAVGVMNATEGYERGNQFAGLLYVARLQYARAFGPLELAIGAGGYLENGPATDTLAGSADLSIGAMGATLLVEGMCDQIEPDEAPATSPEISDALARCGGYGELSYRLPVDRQPYTLVTRLEYLDDNTDLDDAGDALLLSAGVNYRVNPNLRAQLHYLGRYERESEERANDAVILSLQGEL